MSTLRSLATRGTVSALVGAPGQMQAFVAFEIACRAARAGEQVVILSDIDDVSDQVISWRHGSKVQPGERMRIEVVPDRQFKGRVSAAAVLAECSKRKITPTIVVSIELARTPGGFFDHAAPLYVEMAQKLAAGGIGAALAGHSGVVPKQELPLPAGIDRWACVAHQRNGYEVRLTGPRGEAIDVRGVEHVGQYLGRDGKWTAPANPYHRTIVFREAASV